MYNKKYIKNLFKKALEEVLQEQTLTEEERGAVLNDNMDEILEKFPKVSKILEKLMTKDFRSFVGEIHWIAPKPTTFRVVLKNQQDFELKWMGNNFEAEIQGKKYYLGTVDEFQQALDKLNNLYKEKVVSHEDGEDELEEPNSQEGDFDTSGGSSGENGLDFSDPGEDGEEPDETGEESEDLGDEDIDFEEPEA